MELDVLYEHIASPPVVTGLSALVRRIANKELPHGADIVVGLHTRILKEHYPYALLTPPPLIDSGAPMSPPRVPTLPTPPACPSMSSMSAEGAISPPPPSPHTLEPAPLGSNKSGLSGWVSQVSPSTSENVEERTPPCPSEESVKDRKADPLPPIRRMNRTSRGGKCVK